MSDLPEVLFVCVHNAGRSQMAAALLDHHAAGRVRVRSAGSAPADTINPAVVAVMDELGLDLDQGIPQAPDHRSGPGRRRRHHHGLRRRLPRLPRQALPRLAVEDPAGQPAEQIRPIRDEIDARVRELLAELVPVALTPAATTGGSGLCVHRRPSGVSSTRTAADRVSAPRRQAACCQLEPDRRLSLIEREVAPVREPLGGVSPARLSGEDLPAPALARRPACAAEPTRRLTPDSSAAAQARRPGWQPVRNVLVIQPEIRTTCAITLSDERTNATASARNSARYLNVPNQDSSPRTTHDPDPKVSTIKGEDPSQARRDSAEFAVLDQGDGAPRRRRPPA